LNGILTVRQKLVELVMQATEQAQQTGKLSSLVLPEVIIERPQKAGHGDYATSLPLKLARACGKNPIVIAQTLAELILQVLSILPFAMNGCLSR
jgi:arginyl-tRNA synthetase